MKTIILTISPKGETKVETNGFAGQSCKDASKFIENALGKTVSVQFKPEYYENNSQLEHMEVRQ